jgi:hypothetical protein
MRLINKKNVSRRAVLKSAAMLPLASMKAVAQNQEPLWDSAMIMIGSGGTLIGTDRVQCTLFDPNGRAIPEGTVTVDAIALPTTGVANYKWEVRGGRLECSFRLPDPNPSHNQALAFAPAPGEPPNRFYLLLSDNHVLIEDDANFIAEGVFQGVYRLITKCQYFVELDAGGILHPLAPFCTKCVYIFIKR